MRYFQTTCVPTFMKALKFNESTTCEINRIEKQRLFRDKELFVVSRRRTVVVSTKKLDRWSPSNETTPQTDSKAHDFPADIDCLILHLQTLNTKRVNRLGNRVMVVNIRQPPKTAEHRYRNLLAYSRIEVHQRLLTSSWLFDRVRS